MIARYRILANNFQALINIFDPDDAGYFKYLMSLDPKDWKNQDHYKVLGLSKLRWRASEAHIRSACKNFN